MHIVFVRHGHPNYKLDCLTELGHNQAAAAAERLADEGIDKLYTAPFLFLPSLTIRDPHQKYRSHPPQA